MHTRHQLTNFFSITFKIGAPAAKTTAVEAPTNTGAPRSKGFFESLWLMRSSEPLGFRSVISAIETELLPFDVMGLILKDFSYFDLAKLALVNKFFFYFFTQWVQDVCIALKQVQYASEHLKYLLKLPSISELYAVDNSHAGIFTEFDTEYFKTVAQIIKNNQKSLKRITFSYKGLNENVELGKSIIESFQGCTNLRHFETHQYPFPPTSASEYGKIITNNSQTLESIRLEQVVPFNSDGIEFEATIKQLNIQECKSLTTLMFINHSTTDEAANVITHTINNNNKTLQKINLIHNTFITDTGLTNVLKALATCEQLKHLDICMNKLTTNESITALAEIISHNKNTLEYIELGHTQLTDSTLAVILPHIRECKNLTQLRVANNRLSYEMINTLQQMGKENPKLFIQLATLD